MKKKEGKSGPPKMLASELDALRRELRKTVRAYAARLEISLAESAKKIASVGDAEKLSRDRLHEIRDLTIMLRKRKLKPDKGRRKDLRKIDMLITYLHAMTHPDSRASSQRGSYILRDRYTAVIAS
jgi:hypothetical protein